jgi:hypothetical protein
VARLDTKMPTSILACSSTSDPRRGRPAVHPLATTSGRSTRPGANRSIRNGDRTSHPHATGAELVHGTRGVGECPRSCTLSLRLGATTDFTVRVSAARLIADMGGRSPADEHGAVLWAGLARISSAKMSIGASGTASVRTGAVTLRDVS